MCRDESAASPGADSSSTHSFTAIVNEYWTVVYRFLYCSLGDPHDAEDLTQETFLRAWNRLDSFQAGTCMRVWLLKIATNAALDVKRRRRRIGFQTLEHDPPICPAGPEHGLEIAEQCALVERALKELSEMTRMVFHLRAQEDLPFREIAALVGTSEQGARWHMHQARTKLLEQLAEK